MARQWKQTLRHLAAISRPRVPRRLRPVLERPRIARLVLLTRRSVSEHLEDKCQQLAAAISYHLLFSIFPLAIAGIGVLGLVASDPSTRRSLVSDIVSVVPLTGDGRAQVERLLNSVSGTAGALGLIGLVGVLYSASGVMAAVRTAVNLAWDITDQRSFVKGKALDLLLVLSSFLAVTAVLAVSVLTRLARAGSERLPGFLSALAGPFGATVAVVLTGLLLFGAISLLFVLLPNEPVRFRTVWPGSLVVVLGFELLQYGFSVYVANFADYNRVYGSLGTVVALLFLVYLASSVLLFGAEVASEYGRLPPLGGSRPARPASRHPADVYAGGVGRPAPGE